MKNLFFIITLLSSVYSFGQFPPEFPKQLINKVFCGTASTSTPSGSIHGKHFLDFPYRLTIYEDSLFAEYNPKEKWKEDKWGKTQTITELVEWKREPDYNSYNELRGYTIYYKVPYSEAKHSIKEISIWAPINKPEDNQIRIEVYNSTYDDAPLYAYERLICQTLKSKSELIKEEAEKKRLEDERIKLENQKKEADKATLQKINDFLSKNALEDAVKEFGKLNFENSEIKGVLQKKLDDKFGQEEVELNPNNVEDYIKSNTWKINNINPGNYSINFDKSGWPSNMNFPSWSMIPKKEFGSFTVYLKSLTEINIIVKDSILVSSTYRTSNTKPLFIDKNENFYFKTKTGLPVATISNDPSIDKKLVKINKVYKREKYANGILINSQEFKTEKTVGIMKKDQ
jgi:hypothetical protein